MHIFTHTAIHTQPCTDKTFAACMHATSPFPLPLHMYSFLMFYVFSLVFSSFCCLLLLSNATAATTEKQQLQLQLQLQPAQIAEIYACKLKLLICNLCHLTFTLVFGLCFCCFVLFCFAQFVLYFCHILSFSFFGLLSF